MAYGSLGASVIRFKESGAASPRMARILVQITILLSATVPVFALSTSLYRRAPIVPAYLIIGYSCGIVIAVCGAMEIRWVQRGEWHRFSPWFVFLNMILLTTVVTVTNLAAPNDEGVHRVMFLMPLLLTAVVGNLWMIGAVFLLDLIGMGYVAWEASGDVDTTAWTVIVGAAVWFAACGTVHIGVSRFLRSMRSAEAMSRLAGAAAAANGWPDDLQHCAEHVAGAIETDWVVVYSSAPDQGWVVVALWPDRALEGATTPPEPPEVATDDAVTITPEGLVIPVTTATALEITIVTGRSRLPDEEVDAIGRTVGRLVGGIAERSALQASLRAEARQDQLTGLPNRRSLLEAFEREFPKAREMDLPLQVVMLDIDHFKRFNDTWGHLEGDRLLRRMGDALNDISRPADTAARYGGEEFCLVLPGTARVQVAALLGQLRSLLIDAGPEGSKVTFSAGVAMWNRVEPAEELIRRADAALYAAKESGRDRACAAATAPDDEPTPFALVGV